jgi:uncharacterized membrane protein YdbT with pleckstrin-like domain
MIEDKEKIEASFKKVKKAGREIKKRTFSYIAAGLGLVAGLAWNDAISTFINYIIPKTGNTVVAKLVYAVLVTIIVAFILFYVERDSEE